MSAPMLAIQEASVLPVLSATRLSAGYAGRPILQGLDLDVRPGEVLAVLGPNGAGKTTLLRTLAGALPPVSGTVRIGDQPAPRGLHRAARAGIAYVAEERSVFMDLTVVENLRLGRGTAQRALNMFPELAAHRHRKAGLLSGGQQQMLTLSRALAAQPTVLLADELSLGLAPQVVHRLLSAVRNAADDGLAVVLVEQHAHQALDISNTAVVLQRGTVALRGSREYVVERFDEIESSYLAIDQSSR